MLRFLPVPPDGVTVTGTALYRTPKRLDKSIVGSYAGLGVHAPILVITSGLIVRIVWCLCKLALPDESRTKIGVFAIKSYRMG
jgi:hypothetical protein